MSLDKNWKNQLSSKLVKRKGKVIRRRQPDVTKDLGKYFTRTGSTMQVKNSAQEKEGISNKKEKSD